MNADIVLLVFFLICLVVFFFYFLICFQWDPHLFRCESLSKYFNVMKNAYILSLEDVLIVDEFVCLKREECLKPIGKYILSLIE